MGSWDMQITSEEGLYVYEHWGRDTSDILQFDIVLIPLLPFISGLLPSLLCTFPFISLRLPVSPYSFLLFHPTFFLLFLFLPPASSIPLSSQEL